MGEQFKLSGCHSPSLFLPDISLSIPVSASVSTYDICCITFIFLCSWKHLQATLLRSARLLKWRLYVSLATILGLTQEGARHQSFLWWPKTETSLDFLSSPLFWAGLGRKQQSSGLPSFCSLGKSFWFSPSQRAENLHSFGLENSCVILIQVHHGLNSVLSPWGA